MTRFFFHIKDGKDLIEDDEGSEAPDVTVVRALALKAAREMWAEAIKTGQELRADAFVIVDEQGQQIMVLPLTEALPKQLRRR
jgi:hypothetical protein